jgi:WD40 repeat protein
MSDGFGFWDLRTGAPLARQVWPRGAASLKFEDSGALVVHGLAGITRWPISEPAASPGVLRFGPPQVLATSISGEAYSFAISRDGAIIARSEGHVATIWHRDRPLEPIRLGPLRDARSIGVSPDGRRIATGGHSSAEVKVWNADTGLLECQLPVGPISGADFSPDGRWLATTGGDFRFWEVGNWGSKPLPDRALAAEGGANAFSPDGTLSAIDTGRGSVALVVVATGREVARLEPPGKDRLNAIHFSPDGTKLIGPADYQSVHVWDLRAIRRELSAIGLDWDLPPYPPPPETATGPIRIEIDPGPTGTAGGR